MASVQQEINLTREFYLIIGRGLGGFELGERIGRNKTLTRFHFVQYGENVLGIRWGMFRPNRLIVLDEPETEREKEWFTHCVLMAMDKNFARCDMDGKQYKHIIVNETKIESGFDFQIFTNDKLFSLFHRVKTDEDYKITEFENHFSGYQEDLQYMFNSLRLLKLMEG
jgi:hypothetical protein